MGRIYFFIQHFIRHYHPVEPAPLFANTIIIVPVIADSNRPGHFFKKCTGIGGWYFLPAMHFKKCNGYSLCTNPGSINVYRHEMKAGG